MCILHRKCDIHYNNTHPIYKKRQVQAVCNIYPALFKSLLNYECCLAKLKATDSDSHRQRGEERVRTGQYKSSNIFVILKDWM